MKFVNDFKTFLNDEVTLNPTRIARLEQSVEAIETFLTDNKVFGPIFRDVIPAGSWAHRTIIRPVQENDEFDADMLLYIQEQPDWQPKDYLEELWQAFRGSGVYKSKAERKTRCVRIDYECDFHIDVVPYLERSGLHYITNRLKPEGEGRFELSDPEAFSAWIDERQRLTNGHFIKTVRLVKYLRDFKSTFVCKSIILMTLLGNQVNEIEATYTQELYKDVPSTLVTLMEKLADALPETMPAVLDPAETGENFTDRYGETWNYSNFRTQIRSYATQMRTAYDERDRDTSAQKWRDVFGKNFKPDTAAKKAVCDFLSPSVPWKGEQFINQTPYEFLYQLDPRFRTRITGQVIGLATNGRTQRNGFQKFELRKRGNLVPKQRKLLFTISTDVPKPYKVYWKVRNSGAEADRIYALRGEISQDDGSLQKEETTLYTGHHYVECYIVKNGVVVSLDRQNVIVPANR